MHIVKWNAGDSRFRYISMRGSRKRSNRVLFGTVVTRNVHPHENGDDKPAPNGSGTNTHISDEGAKLLSKEIEESNSWARVGFQVYFGWFALQFSVNALAAGWLLARNAPVAHFSLSCLLLITWNLLGALMTVLVYKALAAMDARNVELLAVLNRHYRTSDLQAESQSPIAQASFPVLFGVSAVTMFVSAFFFLFVLIGGQ
jgi:hypothetical protein